MSQRLVGYGVSQVPTNGMLGGMAYQDPINVTVNNISVGSGTLTGTASQPLQVTGGAYVSGSVGIGISTPLTKLDVRGVITAGTDAPNGSEIIRGYYSGGGSLNVIGSEYSSGGLVLGYSVKPSTSAQSAFFSSTGISISRGAYTIAGYEHRWYVGAVQTVAENSSVTMSEVMRIDASGNLGIGTNNPTAKLHVSGSTWSNTTGGDVVISNSGTIGSSINFRPTNSSSYSAGWSLYAGATGAAIGDGAFGFWNHTTRQNPFWVDQSGNANIKLGNLVIGTSGKGIDFSANSNAAGMTSEVLNDYEEGTWTPVWESSGTLPTLSYSTQSGYYIKIGGVVHFWGRIYMSSWGGGGGSGNIRVGGLPFTSSNVANTHKPLCQVTFSYNGGNAVWPSGATQVFAEVINNSTSLQYICLGAPTTQLGDSAPLQWTSNPQMYNNYFSGSYFV